MDVDAACLIVHQLDPFPHALGFTAGYSRHHIAQRAHGNGVDWLCPARAFLSLAPDGRALRQAAQSVQNADCVFGALYRRLRARLGPAQATVATAHAIARVVYRMLKYKVEYETISVTEYEKKYKEQRIKYMKKKAAKLGFQLTPA